jgi:two-component system, OmpR family, alkaline phosphatase synthesis response regulator PhoP
VPGPTVLVVDDERNIVQLAKLYLRNEGYQVESAFNGREALEKVKQVRPNIVLLDLMMPELDGWEVCKQLRRDGDVPIVMLTARGDDVDKVVGLELGADDYITKPFNPRELVARVKAVLRRYDAGRKPARTFRFADLTIDQDRREFRIGDRLVDLRPKEFDLLSTLAGSPGIVFERERLLQLAWGYEYYGDSRTVDVHVTWLRDKLSTSEARIQTVWGVGYKLVAADQLPAKGGSRQKAQA